ncbi:MAG TPA: hypothetical protein VGO52_23590 [Hyphomonadaceae bacterium]|jgi:hypothetical protein|nr:hypothetical protein [Hyphomonadaceae bacterium]
MTKQAFVREDAKEMATILRSAACMARYNKISHELLSELLVAIATNGEVVGGNNRGSDVLSPTHGKIEVKSRILGTDGPFPRISLKEHNLAKADWFAAVRWNPDFTLYDAVLLPKASAMNHYQQKRQSKGLAHIGWKDWARDASAQSIREVCLSALAAL